MDTRLTSALRAFRERYPGEEGSWKRLQGWLLDHAPQEKRAVKALVAVPRLDLHLQMQRSPRLDAFSFRRLTDTLTGEEGLSGDLAEQAVLTWLEVMGVEPPDASALRGPVDVGLLSATLDAARCMHLALMQSDLRPIAQVRLEALTTRPLSELTVSIWLAGVEVGSSLRSSTWTGHVDRLRGRQVAMLDGIDVRVSLQALHEIQAPVHGRWWIEVKHKDDVLLRTFHEIAVVPPRAWLFGRAPLPALAAFVLPGDAMVAEIVGEAAARVAEDDPRAAPVKALEALRAVLGEMGIVEEPGAASEVLCPRAVIARGRGSLLDLQLLLAACLEHAGMPPVLVWCESGPALGLWSGGDRPAMTETDDPQLLARLEEAGALVLAPVGEHALRLADEIAGGGAFAALDVASARRAGVLPLAAQVLDDGRPAVIGGSPPDQVRQRLLDRAALTGARSGVLLPGAWGARLARRAESAEATAPRLQMWKRRLLDLTLHNPLLHLRERVTSLPVMIASPGALEDSLASGQVFVLQARPAAPHPGAPRPDVTAQMIEGATAAGSLLVDLPEKRLVTQAKNALRTFREALDEGGVHTLFLALGSLEWFEAGKPEVPRCAPLLLVPVLLRRSRLGQYQIKKAELDTELNAALLEFLRREHGVEVPGIDPLPADHSGVDVAAVLDAIRRAIAKVPAMAKWSVREDAQIGVIAFSGFRMWRDLDHQAADLLRHPLVRRLALGSDAAEGVEFPDVATLDDRFHPREVLCPLEADGSQLGAILAAANGASFVLEGPPGTGKSQTIANLVAQCLAAGKTVLFVAQKRAALEVVQARLDAIGLGPFILELHSRKASKPEFIQQLRVAAEHRARRPPRDWAVDAEALAAARGELNEMVRALHGQRDPGMSVYQAIAEVETRRDRQRLEPSFDPARAFGAEWLADAKAALADLGPAFLRLAPGWEELDGVRATDWPKARRAEIEAQLDAIADTAAALEGACAGVARWIPNLAGASADELELADLVLAGVQSSPRPKAALLEGAEDEVVAWLAQVEAARDRSAALAERYLPALVDQPLEPRVLRLRQWLGIFFLGWLVLLTVRWFFRPLAVAGVPPNRALLADAEAAIALRLERAEIAGKTARIAELIGAITVDAWGLPTVDVAGVRTLVAWTTSFRKRATRFPAALLLAAKSAPDVAQPLAGFRAAHSRHAEATRAVVTALDLTGGLVKHTEKEHVTGCARRAAALRAAVPQLRDWGAYRRNRDACVALGLGKLVRALERGVVASDALVDAFITTWTCWWLDQRILEDKALSTFDGLKQRGREERFGELDRSLLDLSRHEIRARLAARQPRLDQGAPPSSQAGILLRQFSRRAGFASPRQLFSECGGLIRQLKPCVLMSPQSVAQYLDPSQPPFDLVVFDEASQVPTHEAIGAIARGRQVVVVGDSKQLPPTSFFAGGQGKDDDDEVMAELDSILEECAGSGLPSLQLAWHYRSRHPSLIAFSNSRYYSARLQVLPAARARAPHLGVSRVLVPAAVYDRGGSATNRAEAQALVADVVRRLRDPEESRRSLGVVTFSRAQQGLIEDLLEEARERWPEIEPFFDAERPESVIVKNLENIQGDERDVVLFSIGYGPDAQRKITANMGPLGQLGGERRLNVAITRAREQLVIFVSFEPRELDLSASAAQGLHDLKAFLESAAAGGEALVGSDHLELDPAEVTLKHALSTELEARGHVVDLDVGVGRYRIDIAVRDPADAGTYLLGVEMDGPRYAASDTARDRDRLRWEVLAGLGWRALHRVRALDWYEDRDRVVSDVLARIETAKNIPQNAAIATPPTTTAATTSAAPPAAGATPASSTSGPPALDAWTPTPAPIGVAPALSQSPPDAGPEADGATDETEFATATEHAMAYRICRPASRSGNFAWTHRELPEVLAQLIAEEGPIVDRLVARRVADVWGLKRAPSGIAQVAASLLQKIPAPRRPLYRDGFFWPQDLDPERWRAYRVPDRAEPTTRRDLEDIPIEELANAADDLLARYGQMPREDLARAVAKRFGYRGLTRGVGPRLELGLVEADRRRPPSAD